MTSRPTTCSAATISASGRSPRWPGGPASCSSGAASATTRSTSWPCASTSGSCSPSASTSSGTWRAAAPGPASCARRATACWPTWPRRSLGAGPRPAARGRPEDPPLGPGAIPYDQPRGVSAMAAEQAGAAKKAEGLGWLAAYARGQLARVGTVHVGFAEPISLRAALPPGGPDGDSVRLDPAAPPSAGLDPAAPPNASLDPAAPPKDAWRLALQKVAFEVAVRINRVTPVTATALVTLALLGVRDRALTLGQVRGVLEPLRGYLAERG